MTTRAKKIFSEAMKLSYRERVALADKLRDSADEKEWMDELEKRIDDLDAGRVKPIPVRKALALMKKAVHAGSRKR